MERIYFELKGESLEQAYQKYIDKELAEAVEVAVAEALAEQAAYIKELETKLGMQNA